MSDTGENEKEMLECLEYINIHTLSPVVQLNCEETIKKIIGKSAYKKALRIKKKELKKTKCRSIGEIINE